MGVTAVKKPEASHLFLTDLLFCCIWLSQKEKDLKAKSGRTDHGFDRPFPFLRSLLAHLSPFSLSLPLPQGTAPWISRESRLSHLCLSPRLSSPHWVSFLSQGPAGRHVGTGGRQAAHPGSRGSRHY